MKAISLDQPQHFRHLEIPEPAAPAPGEALVRIHRIGICGTDYGGYLGKMPFFSYPRIPGHELGVEVLAVGDGVVNVKPATAAPSSRTSTARCATRAAAATRIAARRTRPSA